MSRICHRAFRIALATSNYTAGPRPWRLDRLKVLRKPMAMFRTADDYMQEDYAGD